MSTTLETTPRRKARGELVRLRTVAPAGAPPQIDREAGIIRGAQMLAKGVVKDERYEIDDVFLAAVLADAAAQRQGVKSRFDHPSASSTSMGTHIGRARNWRREGDVLRADIHLLAAAANAPQGDLRGYVLDMAEQDPDAFGVSIQFHERRPEYRRNEDGTIQRDAEGQPLPPFPRLKKLWAADVVDTPDATSGLFSAITQTPAGVAAAFLDRYLDARGVEFKPVQPADHTEPDRPEGRPSPGHDALSAVTEDQTMKDQTKPGGSATAVTEPQQNAAPPAAPAPATPAADPPAEQLSAAERKQLAAAERKRIREITALGKALGRDQLAAQLIEEEVDLGAATSRLLAEAAAAEDNRPPRLEPGRDATDKFRVAALNGIMLRSGQPVLAEDIHKSPQALSEASDLRGMSMVELARECIYRETGQRSYGSKMEAVGFAMTSTSDFPYLLSNVAHKSMLKGYAAKPGTWRQWCAIGSVPDFKQFTRVLVSEADDLVLNPEGAEYEESSLDEKRQRGQAYTYGRLFSVTRHALVNDDLDQLTKQPMRFGMSSERLISTLVYTLLMSGSSAMGPTLDDGSALFVDGTNWFDDGDVSGFNSTLDLTNGQAAINHAAQLLRKQYNLKGLEPIDVTPRFCLIPPEVEMYARILFGSVGNVTDDKNAGVINPWRGFVEPIVEARLSASSYTGYSATAWYLLGAPGEVDTCEVCFLDGQQSPRFEQEEGFRIDGVTFKVSTDAGVTWLDRKGVVKSKGAA